MTDQPSEHAEQVAVVKWLRARGINFFAVPNGAKMGRREASKMKKEGMTPGVADLIIIDPPPALSGVFAVALEMKVRAGGRLSASQKEWRAQLPANWLYLVGAGAQDAILQLKGLGYDETI